MEQSNLKAYIAEAIGTFILVFFACGVAVLTGQLLATAITFGLVIVIMAAVIGPISGCHINPAVSLACLMTKRMSSKDFIGYVIGQVVGAVIGGICLFGILKIGDIDFVGSFATAGSNFAPTRTLSGANIAAAMFVEAILTFVFVYVILHVTDEKNGQTKHAGLIIGATLTFVHLLGINLTKTSVNPARSIGTAIANALFGESSEALEHVWIFIIAPLGGAALAALAYEAIKKLGNNQEANKPENTENKAAEKDSVAE